MTDESTTLDDDHVDDHVDDAISACLDLDNLRSFFVYAGAGSGKTRSLVTALNRFREDSGKRLRLQGRHVGVITYTNAACDEIKRRLEFDPLVEVSTIHSFVWSLICGFHSDIRAWLKHNLAVEIAGLEEKQRKGRSGTKAALDREKSIASKTDRLAGLERIKRFTYNPNGDNVGRDSLNHSEVIKIGSDFLVQKPLMQRILISKFPILLIDESQDANRHLMEALLSVQEGHRDKFVLGLLGDTMQRIYGDGKEDLGRNVPTDWKQPVKQMNHRSAHRIVRLANKIRESVDGQEQRPRRDRPEGYVRLFVLPSETADKFEAEREIAVQMADITDDEKWSGQNANFKTLTLEHHMAASRMGFLDMFEPLYRIDRLRTGLLDGSLPGLRLFSGSVLPLVKAKMDQNDFTAAAILKKHSPLLNKATLRASGNEQLRQIEKARTAVDELLALWSDRQEPLFIDVLRNVAQSGLFEIPDSLRPIANRTETEQRRAEDSSDDEFGQDYDHAENTDLSAWDAFLQTPFSQIVAYVEYVDDLAPFGTHQGIKGLEFPRVMVIIDDEKARGFLFSYEKLFGVKEKTKTDIERECEGRETGIDRTRRLFYVTCTRAEDSLAVVAYSSNPDRLRSQVLSDGWFEDDEIVMN